MKKATFKDIPPYFNTRESELKSGIKGCLYFLCDNLTNEEKQTFESTYNNVTFFISEKQYAPELKTTVIFLAN